MSDWSPEPWEMPELKCCSCYGESPYSEDEYTCECECHE